MAFRSCNRKCWSLPTWIGSKQLLVDELRARGHDWVKGQDRSRLHTMLLRCERSLLLYEGCKLEELLRFIAQRRLQQGDTQRKAIMVKTLELADEEARFENFLQLPPELRVAIYELSFSDEDLSDLVAPVQPPIARVSRQLRSEVLGVFYDHIHVRTNFFAVKSSRTPRYAGSCIQLRELPDFATFIRRTSEEHLALIRHWKIIVDVAQLNEIDEFWKFICLTLVFSKDGKKFELMYTGSRGGETKAGRKLHEGFEAYMREDGWCTDRGRWAKQAFTQLRIISEEALEEVARKIRK